MKARKKSEQVATTREVAATDGRVVILSDSAAVTDWRMCFIHAQCIASELSFLQKMARTALEQERDPRVIQRNTNRYENLRLGPDGGLDGRKLKRMSLEEAKASAAQPWVVWGQSLIHFTSSIVVNLWRCMQTYHEAQRRALEHYPIYAGAIATGSARASTALQATTELAQQHLANVAIDLIALTRPGAKEPSYDAVHAGMTQLVASYENVVFGIGKPPPTQVPLILCLERLARPLLDSDFDDLFIRLQREDRLVAAAPPPGELPLEQQRVWDALNGSRLTAPELAEKFTSSPEAIRQLIEQIRERKGEGSILNLSRSKGYHRPDAPPPGL